MACLGRVLGAEALADLKVLADDANTLVRNAVADALGRLSPLPAEALVILTRLLDDEPVAQAARTALARHEVEAVPPSEPGGGVLASGARSPGGPGAGGAGPSCASGRPAPAWPPAPRLARRWCSARRAGPTRGALDGGVTHFRNRGAFLPDADVDNDIVIEATRRWISAVVIGLNLCPFAQRVFKADRIRYVVTDAEDRKRCSRPWPSNWNGWRHAESRTSKRRC